MKPLIDHTEFGQINIDGKAYDYDVLITSDGSIKKRKKKLSKKVYGTSHTLSVDEALYIYENNAGKITIGIGKYASSLAMDNMASWSFLQVPLSSSGKKGLKL